MAGDTIQPVDPSVSSTNTPAEQAAPAPNANDAAVADALAGAGPTLVVIPDAAGAPTPAATADAPAQEAQVSNKAVAPAHEAFTLETVAPNEFRVRDVSGTLIGCTLLPTEAPVVMRWIQSVMEQQAKGD